MFLRTSPFTTHPLAFGRNARTVLPTCSESPSRRLFSSDDLRLFGLTFAAGFLSVSILIA